LFVHVVPGRARGVKKVSTISRFGPQCQTKANLSGLCQISTFHTTLGQAFFFCFLFLGIPALPSKATPRVPHSKVSQNHPVYPLWPCQGVRVEFRTSLGPVFFFFGESADFCHTLQANPTSGTLKRCSESSKASTQHTRNVRFWKLFTAGRFFFRNC